VKEEGRRKKEEGRRKKEEKYFLMPHAQFPIPNFPIPQFPNLKSKI
jgi:hypothetical protein